MRRREEAQASIGSLFCRHPPERPGSVAGRFHGSRRSREPHPEPRRVESRHEGVRQHRRNRGPPMIAIAMRPRRHAASQPLRPEYRKEVCRQLHGYLARVNAGRYVISVLEVARGVVSKTSAFRPNSMRIAVTLLRSTPGGSRALRRSSAIGRDHGRMRAIQTTAGSAASFARSSRSFPAHRRCDSTVSNERSIG